MANIITGRIEDNFKHNVEASNAMALLTGACFIVDTLRDEIVKDIIDNDDVFEAMRMASSSFISNTKIVAVAKAIAFRSKVSTPEKLFLQDILTSAIADALAE